MTRKNHLPTLRRRSVRGTVYQCASFRLGDTTRQRTYGRWGDAEGRALFEQDLAEWLANGRTFAQATTPAPVPESRGPLPIGDLVERYLEHERSDHGAAWWHRNGRDLSYNAREFASWLGESVDASTVGPKTLKDFVTHVVTRPDPKRPDRPRICVKTAREKRRVVLDVFRWAVSEELLPASAHHALQAVKAAKTGREGTRGSVKRHPVRWVHVRPVLDELSAPVRALVLVLWHTGARPSELFDLRPCDIDQRGETWKAELTAHKTAAKGHRRVLFFGAAAQDALRPLMLRPAKRTLFSPKDAVAPIGEGIDAARPPGDTYDAPALGKAVRRAVARYNRRRAHRGRKPIPAWTPYQLRHAAATRFRKQHGIEVARVLLGHTSAAMTEVYAEADFAAAAKVAAAAC